MKQSILLLAACAIVLVGCKKEKEGDVSIQINAGVESSTKTKAPILGTTFPEDATDVFAVSASKITGDLASPFFSQASVSTVGATPTFTPAQFYPGADKLYFYAYAPVSTTYTGGAEPVVNYDLAAQSGQADIMHASDLTGLDKNSAGPSFAFTHKLMMFKFTVKATVGSPIIGRYVKRVEIIDQPINAALNIVSGTISWGATKGSITAYDAKATSGTLIGTAASNSFGVAMIAPSTGSFKIKVSFGSSEASSLVSTLESIGNLTTASEGVAGKSHVINMTINPTEINMTTTITDWVPGAGGEVSFE